MDYRRAYHKGGCYFSSVLATSHSRTIPPSSPGRASNSLATRRDTLVLFDAKLKVAPRPHPRALPNLRWGCGSPRQTTRQDRSTGSACCKKAPPLAD